MAAGVAGRGRWTGKGNEGLGAVAVEVEEESRVLLGDGKGGEIVCFLWPVGWVGLSTVVRGKKIGVPWERVLGSVGRGT